MIILMPKDLSYVRCQPNLQINQASTGKYQENSKDHPESEQSSGKILSVLYQSIACIYLKIIILCSLIFMSYEQCSCTVWGMAVLEDGFNYGICQNCSSGCYLHLDQIRFASGSRINKGNCYPCNCNSCTDFMNCSSCKQYYYPTINTPYYPTGYSLSQTYITCELNCTQAIPSCQTCINSTACAACITATPPLFMTSNNTCMTCLQYDPNCLTCSAGPICTGCANSSFLSNNTCTPCISGCLSCVSLTNCSSCVTNFILVNNSCLICNTVISSCMTCNSNGSQCLLCTNFTVVNPTDKKCQLCDVLFPYCLLCNQTTNLCFQCPVQYFLNSTSYCQPCSGMCLNCTSFNNCILCSNKSTLYNGLCYLYGCLSPVKTSNITWQCIICDRSKYFKKLPNNTCICRQEFLFNQTSQNCIQKCGDGKTFQYQCDDGNLQNYDGCDKDCQIQNNFDCNVTQNTTICVYQGGINLQLQKIIKNQDNSAVIIIHNTDTFIPYKFYDNQFKDISGNIINFFQLQMIVPTSPPRYYVIPTQLKLASNNQIHLLINFQFNIQNFQSVLKINMSKTQYSVPNNQIKMRIKLNGRNEPLKIKRYPQHIKALSIGMLSISISTFLMLLVGMFSVKYIGIQLALTLQLIYYSQLLIFPSTKYPSSFTFINKLKYVNGYNDLFEIVNIIPINSYQRKISYIGIYKMVMQNYNLSFGLLLIGFGIFICGFLMMSWKNAILNQYLVAERQRKSLLEALPEDQKDSFMKQLKNKLYNIISKFEICYRIFIQISTWSILQIMSCLSVFLMISNSHIQILQSHTSLLITFQAIILFISLMIIFITGLNFYWNAFLHRNTLQKSNKRPHQQSYKAINFIYLIIVGSIVFFFNQFELFGILPTSMVVMPVHIIYLVYVNFILRPYQKSLVIHRRGLLFNHVIYLIYLILINLINFIDQIHQILIVAFGYTISGCSILLIVVTAIRLYYEYRYGQLLELKVQKQQQMQELKRKHQQHLRYLQRREYYQQQAKRKLQKDKIQKQRRMNQYLYQNQLLEEDKQSYLHFLQNKQFISKQQKQKLYFQKYDSKPLKWLKSNQPEKYDKVIKQQTLKNQLKIQKLIKNQQYKQIKSKIKKSLKLYELKHENGKIKHNFMKQIIKQRLQSDY